MARPFRIIWISVNSNESVFGQWARGDAQILRGCHPFYGPVMKSMFLIGTGNENIDI